MGQRNFCIVLKQSFLKLNKPFILETLILHVPRKFSFRIFLYYWPFSFAINMMASPLFEHRQLYACSFRKIINIPLFLLTNVFNYNKYCGQYTYKSNYTLIFMVKFPQISSENHALSHIILIK